MKVTCTCGACLEMGEDNHENAILFHQLSQVFLIQHQSCRETQNRIAIMLADKKAYGKPAK